MNAGGGVQTVNGGVQKIKRKREDRGARWAY